jgi:sporulation protein YlmC with PRC-barrel domain
MLQMKNMSNTINIRAYIDTGEFFGDVEEAILIKNKIESWKIKASKNSYLTRALSGAKGVIVPHQFVKAIGDIMIIAREAAPKLSEEE